MESFFESLSTLVQRQDSIFSFTLFVAAAAFVAAELFWLARYLTSRRVAVPRAGVPEDDTRFSVLWSIVPAFVLVMLAFVQVGPAKSASQDKGVKAPQKITRHVSLPSRR